MKTAPKTGKKAKNPVGITDTTFRDGHQSLLATRTRLDDLICIAEKMDSVGFHSLEVWGGATFDVCTRFLNEDPWERLRTLKKLCKKTPLQMLLRGQNLVGYRNYADDVVEAFVMTSAECGMDIFRVFDALNDERNFEAAFKAIKKARKHIQATLCYSLTERLMGGPVFNIDYYVKKAKRMEGMGADSLCIKDMAGILAPNDAYTLVSALKKAVKIPLQLHCHYTSGMASMTYLKAIEAGVDVVDTALAPFGLRSSQPAVEPFVVTLEGTERDTGLDLNLLSELGDYIESVAPKYRDFLDCSKMGVIDTGVLMHQIPGGMISNLVSQLKEAGALDRLHEVYEELPRMRKELGYPPLVTPTSQIVGIQAVQNVLFGRYKMITSQVKDYAYGLYGKPPAPMEKKVQELILKGYERGEKPITCRAADILEPELEKAKQETKGIAKNIEDVLTYAMYPTTGLRFLRWKYGLEPVPDSVKPKTLEQIKKEDELMAKARAGKLFEKPEKAVPEKGPGVRTFNVFVDGEYYQVEVEEHGGIRQISDPMKVAAPQAATAKPSAPAPALQKQEAPPVAITAGETAVTAPMPGLIIEYKIKEGSQVKAGDVLLILEAMKMQNNITAPVAGVVKKLFGAPGTSVPKDSVLCIIEAKQQ
jgi:pyruvate carboxylase subunit B